jgi:uncharacterized delta-60 repeat protein
MLSLTNYFILLRRNTSLILTIAIALLAAQLAQGQCPMSINSPAGSLDTCFNQAGTGGFGGGDGVYTIALQSDGKILAGGRFNSYNATTRKSVCRLNADGTLDTTFSQTGSGLNNWVGTVALQPDGKVLVGGSFSFYNGATRNGICRLKADGTLDASFAPVGTGLNNGVKIIALQPNGKVLVGGDFDSYNGTPRKFICRLNANGTLDATYAQAGTGLNNSANTIALQPDGKVLVGGAFVSYNGTQRNCICRLNADGTLDTTFAPSGTGLNGVVYALALQPDGKFLVGGAFTSYNNIPSYRVCRLNSDGSLDTSFTQMGTGIDFIVYSLAIQPDGKVLVGGYFTSYNGIMRNYFSRLNSNGSLDSSFTQLGTGFNNLVYTTALQADGKVLVGGFFTFYNSTPKNYLARLFATNTTVATKPISQSDITLYPNPAQTHITLQTDVPVGYKLLSTTGVVWQEGIAQPGGSLTVAKLPPGVYSVLLTQGQSVVVKRFVKE